MQEHDGWCAGCCWICDSEEEKRPRHHGVRNFGGSFGCYRHLGHNGVQAEDPNALGRNCDWNQQLATDASCRLLGQGVVEYAIVTAAFVAVALALGAFWRLLHQGAFVEHAFAAATYCLQAAWPAAVADLFLY